MTPLDLRDLFSEPWEGDAVVEVPWWARIAPTPRRFRFRSEIANLRGDEWDVIDTMTLPDGTVRRRTMHARVVAPGLIESTAPDMPRPARLHLRADGFDFEPYVIRTPVLGPLRLPLRHADSVRLEGDQLVDVIVVRYLGVRLARVTMRLRRTGSSAG